MSAIDTVTHVESSARDPEEGLRELRAVDWVTGTVIGVAVAATLFFIGPDIIANNVKTPVLVLGFGMGLLAYLDHCTRLIRNRHNLLFAVATALAIGISALIFGSFPWLSALIGAAAVFTFMLVLTAMTGFAGGGDIKLSPIPGAVLAAVNPLAACLWLLVTFLTCLITMVIAQATKRADPKSAMGPYMAIALVPAILGSSAILTHYGMA